jgi:hypothetical protein
MLSSLCCLGGMSSLLRHVSVEEDCSNQNVLPSVGFEIDDVVYWLSGRDYTLTVRVFSNVQEFGALTHLFHFFRWKILVRTCLGNLRHFVSAVSVISSTSPFFLKHTCSVRNTFSNTILLNFFFLFANVHYAF